MLHCNQNCEIKKINKNFQVKPPCTLTKEESEYLTNRIQNGGTEVVEVMSLSAFHIMQIKLENEI